MVAFMRAVRTNPGDAPVPSATAAAAMAIFANHTPCLQRLDNAAMETLAKQIEQRMHGEWRHCAIYERDLERLWPLNEKDREAKISQFATQYGFRLSFYSKGNVAIFDKPPPR